MKFDYLKHTAALSLSLAYTHTHVHNPLCDIAYTRTYTPYEAFYLKHHLILKRKNLLSTMCVCTRGAASVNYKGTACISANSIAGMVLGDHVSGLKALCYLEIIQTSRSSNNVFYICCGG